MNADETRPTEDREPRGHQVADALAQDARAKEARMLPEEGPLSDDQLRWAAETFTAYVKTRELSTTDVARQLGVPTIKLDRFIAGAYHYGGEVQLARKLVRWVRQMEDADREGRAATYVSTGVADKMLGIIDGVNKVRMMGVIVGPSGISKSTVCRAAEAGLFPGSVHIELTQAHGTPLALARLIARRLDGKRKSGSLAFMMESLIELLSGSGRLLLIDEAHYLSRAGCQVLRDLHKQTGCPMVLVGTRDVLDTINDFNEFAGQFKRLFAYTLDITEELAATGDPLYSPREVAKFAKSMGLRLTPDGLGYAAELACILGWGGLGALRGLLLNARLLARDRKTGEEKPIDARILKRALLDMEGHTGLARVGLRSHAQQAARKVAVG